MHMGSAVAWQFRFRHDGAFYEEVRSKHLTFKWGFDGSSTATCWEVSSAGYQGTTDCSAMRHHTSRVA